MMHHSHAIVGRFASESKAEKALVVLEESGFNFKKLFLIRAQYEREPAASRRILRKSVVAGVILGTLVGSWTGKALLLLPPLLGLMGRGTAAERGWATLEDGLIAGGLGALGALLYQARLARGRRDPAPAAEPGAPFRVEIRGTPQDISKAQGMLADTPPEKAVL